MLNEKAMKAAMHVYNVSYASDKDTESAVRCAIVAYETARDTMPEFDEVERVTEAIHACEQENYEQD